jgi:hypothetical protein
MHNDEQRRRQIRRQPGRHVLQRGYATGGPADDDDVASGHWFPVKASLL